MTFLDRARVEYVKKTAVSKPYGIFSSKIAERNLRLSNHYKTTKEDHTQIYIVYI